MGLKAALRYLFLREQHFYVRDGLSMVAMVPDIPPFLVRLRQVLAMRKAVRNQDYKAFRAAQRMEKR